MKYEIIIVNIIHLEDTGDVTRQWEMFDQIMRLSQDLVCIAELCVDIMRQLHRKPGRYSGYQMTSFGMITVFSKLPILKMISYPDISQHSVDILDIILEIFNVRIYYHSGYAIDAQEVCTFSRINPEYTVLVSSSDNSIHHKLNTKHDYAGGLAIINGKNIIERDIGTLEISSTISLIGVWSKLEINPEVESFYNQEKSKSRMVSNLSESIQRIFKSPIPLSSICTPEKGEVKLPLNSSSHIHNVSLRESSSIPLVTTPRYGESIKDMSLIVYAENSRNDKKSKFRNILNFWHTKSNKDEPRTDE
jgi:hypothetical protein